MKLCHLQEKSMDLEIITLSEINQTEKQENIPCSLSYVVSIPKKKKKMNDTSVKWEDCL
jgi:hypothetical protein